MEELKYLPHKVIIEQDKLLSELLLFVSEQEAEILRLQEEVKNLKLKKRYAH